MVNKLYRILRTLSLDVVAGACVGSLFIARYLQVNVPLLYLVALAICVWLIYTADHLVDAFRVKHAANSYRHLYYQQYFVPLCGLTALLLFAGLLVASRLPDKLISWGWGLTALVCLYFVLMKIKIFHRYSYKEAVSALLYTAGIFLPPLSVYHGPWTMDIFFIFVQFTLLALSNLLIFALYEAEADQKDGHPSFVLSNSEAVSRILIYSFLALVAGPALLSHLLLDTPDKLLATEFVLLLMALALFLIAALPSFFRYQERYRVVGDAVFLFPLLLLIF